jgi:hypothetical protein
MITLAHFADDYEMAQPNSAEFLRWTEHLAVGSKPSIGRYTKGRQPSSLVMDRIVDICFPELQKNTAESGAEQKSSREREAARNRSAKTVQDWLRLGKPWSQIIQRFGYGIMRLMPSEHSGEL